MQTKIGLIVGSLRRGAYTRLLAQAVTGLAPPSLLFSEIAIGELPLYNQDLETGTPPAAWQVFRERVRETAGVLFITPEYNRGVPAALKNAIDVGSRPWGHSVWSGKPAAVISLTPGLFGGMSANQQLRMFLSVLRAPVMPHPEGYIAGAAGLFNERGELQNTDVRALVSGLLLGFEAWIGRFER